MPKKTDTRPALPERVDDNLVAVDTEGSGLFPDDGARLSIISVACRIDGRLYEHAWPYDQGKEGKPGWDGQADLFSTDDEINLPIEHYRAVCTWLASRDLIMQNAPHDLRTFRQGLREAKFGPDTGYELVDRVVWDTQLVNKELWPRETTSLKPTAARLFGEDETAEQKALKPHLGPKDNPRFDLVPWEIIGPYAAKDASLTYRLYEHQIKKIDAMVPQSKQRAMHWINRAFDVMRVLYQIERRGIPYDYKESLKIATELSRYKQRIATELPYNPTEVQAKHYYFGPATEKTKRGVPCLGLPAYSVTDKGNPQLTVEIVDEMIEEGIPFAKQWSDYDKLSRAISMWYGGYAHKTGPDGRLRASFRQAHVKSGRFSVERVNLQAIPSDFKIGKGSQILVGNLTPWDLIVRAIPAGYQLWNIDLAQAELRLAAKLAECRVMLDAFRDGTDLHGYTAQAIFEVDKDHPKWGMYRQLGKRANFSCCFGTGGETFAQMVLKDSGIRLPLARAKQIVQDWNTLYPQYRDAMDRYEGIARRTQKIRLINGKYSYFMPYEDYRSGFSRRVQGSLAELGQDLDVWIEGYLQERIDCETAGLVNLVHDSQLLLLPEDIAERLVKEIVDYCSEYATRFCGVLMALDSKHLTADSR